MPPADPPTSSASSDPAPAESFAATTRHSSFGSWRLVGLCTFSSRVLGLARDAAMAALFGGGPLLDAFTVAFRIPNLARVLLGEGVLATAFLPQLLQSEREEGQPAAFRLATAVCMLLIGGLSLLVMAAQLALLAIVWPLLTNPDNRLLCELTAYLLPYVVFVCAAAQLSTILHAFHRFTAAALIPVVLNFGWLLALGVVVQFVEDPRTRLKILSALIVLLGACQCVALLPSLKSVGFRYQPDWWRARTAVWATLWRMGPILAALLVLQMSAVWESGVSWLLSADSQVATTGTPWLAQIPGLENVPAPLPSGAASFLYLGQRLYQFPIGIFGIALGTVLYPLLTRHAQARDWPAFQQSTRLATRLVVAIGVPASVGLVCLAFPITDLLFGRGAFDVAAIQRTSEVIQAYGVGVWAMCGLVIVQRAFYALDDRWTPLYIAFVGTAVGMLAGFIALWWLGTAGLALGTTLSAMLQVVVNGTILHRRIDAHQPTADPAPPSRIGWQLFQVIFTNVLMAGACLALSRWSMSHFQPHGPTLDRLLLVVIPMSGAIAVFAAASKLVGYRDPWLVLQRKPLSQT